jgi:hypothetical protein
MKCIRQRSSATRTQLAKPSCVLGAAAASDEFINSCVREHASKTHLRLVCTYQRTPHTLSEPVEEAMMPFFPSLQQASIEWQE